MHFCETDSGWLSLNRKPTLCRAKLSILGFVMEIRYEMLY